MTDNKDKDKRLSLRLTKDRYDTLHVLAVKYGETDSAMIRMAINFFISKQE
jgi:predicted DNA-binding protein